MMNTLKAKTTWPENCDKMSEIFKKLKKVDERGRAVQFLSALTETHTLSS